MKKGDTIKDVKAYIHWRIEHLRLESQKVKFTVKPELRDKVYKKLLAKITELRKTLNTIEGNIKEASKFEYSKVEYLKKKKVGLLALK